MVKHFNYAQATSVAPGQTPQSQPIPGREAEMVQNNAGGFTFTIDDWGQLQRFLVIGTAGNTYYVNEKDATTKNATLVTKLLKQDMARVLTMAGEVSDRGLALKNDQAIFVVAMAFVEMAREPRNYNQETRTLASNTLLKVARIGTHLFTFVDYVNTLNGGHGWGRTLRRAVGRWFSEKPAEKLAYQTAKYGQRDGWSQKDVIRLSHPSSTDPQTSAVIGYTAGKIELANLGDFPAATFLRAVEEAKHVTKPARAIELITEFGLTHEMLATEMLALPEVWLALLEKMPLTALVRNLGRMSANGAIKDFSPALNLIETKLGDAEYLRKSRMHPLQVLIALNQYKQGQGDRGSKGWTVNHRVLDALDAAFYKSFEFVAPTGKNIGLFLDVSGSMTSDVNGVRNISCRTASAALAMAVARCEKNYTIMGFTARQPNAYTHSSVSNRGWGGGSAISPLAISPRQRLDDITRYIDRLDFSGTDCALPMVWATETKTPIETFVVITDNETWAGSIQPAEALNKFRRTMGINAKLIVIGMTTTNFTIGDPKDAGTLNIAGFSADVPTLVSNFIRGDV